MAQVKSGKVGLQQSTERLAMSIEFDDPRGDRGYAHVWGYVRMIDFDDMESVTFPSSKDFLHVAIRNQTDRDHLNYDVHDDFNRFYGVEVVWSQDCMNADDCAVAAKCMAKIERKLSAIRDQLGNPSTMGDLFLRVAQVIGIRDFVAKESGGYKYKEIADKHAAKYLIDSTVQHWKDNK